MAEQVVRPMSISDRTISRFWGNVGLPGEDGCMLWLGAPNSDGYGQLSQRGDYFKAHRIACFLAHGEPVGGSKYAVHSCRSRLCVAPTHLRWATSQENHNDMKRDGTDPTGERHGRAVLSDEAVLAIRKESAGLGTPRKDLAVRYGVNQATISAVLRRKTWQHVR